MRPSSSTSDGLFDGVLARGPVRAAVDDRAWLVAMLEVEAALARAEASVGLVPVDAAAAIGRTCVQVDRFDLGAIGAAAAATGNPVVPLIEAIRASVGGTAAKWVHHGATSQDIVDSAAMLVARRATEPLLVDLAASAEAAASLATVHRDTPMVARTLLQQAVPTTFGLVAAGWMSAIDAAAARLAEVRDTRLAVQLGGAAGTLAAFGADGPRVVAALARELDLAEPDLPWHTDRTRVAEVAGALGSVAGVTAKVAGDVVLLAQTEVAEVRDTVDRGGSSAMPHKRNPVAAVSAIACALPAPGLVATLLTTMAQEHQRAAGAWQAEQRPLTELLRTTGSAAAWLRDCLEHVEPDPARMLANLELASADLGTDLVNAGVLVDRALEAHRAGRAAPDQASG